MQAEAPIENTTLRDVGEGYRVLYATGLSPEIDQVSWEDEEGEYAVVSFIDGTELKGAGNLAVHAVWHEDAASVTPAHLAQAPALPAPTQSMEARVDDAYDAYIAGDIENARAQLASLAAERFTGDYIAWVPVSFGLSLLALIEEQRGETGCVAALTAMLDEGCRSGEDRSPTRGLARKLASPLPQEVSASSLQDIIYRWAHGEGLCDRQALKAAHDRMLAALRASV
ncbi:hypothetical protein EV679_2133 [Kerstersia gyiorum]|uniref:Uncharacterized protein n=2 Tax=Kerstersia gyiorum TaxID=206506 RepID=A0A4Q7MMD2_9BURK|nr:hypothetical protein [Kerstersia gyiorum]KAB0544412.1 hypothetical protein F7P85_02910 [Kerstersia gyiorum]RZS69534.1 hypothetical protein EV679_2133 [Kerstersia gyiorum]